MLKGIKEIDEIETEILIKYVVAEDEYDSALKVVEQFNYHPIATSILRNYYAELPEGREEMACDLRVVAERQGAFIFALKTTAHEYLYVGSNETVQYIGRYDQGIEDEDILLHFGFKDTATFTQKTVNKFDTLDRLTAKESASTCVACGVAVGEPHILGCPVEQCPWCDGQLNRCNCRFDQLGVEAIDDEELLDRFEDILIAKGRVLFAPGQNPSYPTAGDDPGPASSGKKQ